MFESLSEKLERSFKVIKRAGTNYRDQRGRDDEGDHGDRLLDADVNYKIAKEFTDRVPSKGAWEKTCLTAVSPGQLLLTKITRDRTRGI